jgi:cytoskeletal protein RodZ
MQMNDKSYRRLILSLLLAAVSVFVIATGAESQTSTSDQTTVPSEESSQTSPDTGESTRDAEQAAEKTPPASGAAVTPLKEFKPTEKIDADSAVSFPIDI